MEHPEKHKSQIVFAQIHIFCVLAGNFCADWHKKCVICTILARREALSNRLHKSQITFWQKSIFFYYDRPLSLPLSCALVFTSHFCTMSRGHCYTIAKIDCLLEIIEDILPIGPNDLDRVIQLHSSYYAGQGQTCKTLKRKFVSLYNHKKSTGDPTCPPHMKNVKRIWDLIKLEMGVSDGKGRVTLCHSIPIIPSNREDVFNYFEETVDFGNCVTTASRHSSAKNGM